jgi:glycosyltransferase involved in cell wall biosynthesis
VLRRNPGRVRILLVVNADWFFLSHRLPLALAAQKSGAEVIVVAGETGRSAEIRAAGLDFVELPISRSGTGVITNLKTLVFLIQLYRRLRPDLVHHVTVKPVVYGSLAARLVGGSAIVNAISGLAYTFSSPRLHARIVRRFVISLYRLALRSPKIRTIFQNPDDRDELVRLRIVRPEQTVLIRGSGVDCSLYRATPEPDDVPVVMLPARMLQDKGVREFVAAAGLLQRSERTARFVLVGDADLDNPGSIPPSQLEQWRKEGVVEWWGHQTDMPRVLSQANVVVLPSYREGLPKVLLEAAASGRAIVTSDVPGCREIVQPGLNGLLVPARDAAALASAIEMLLDSPELRSRLGACGRQRAVNEFSEEIVVKKTLDLYRSLLGHRWPATSPSAAPSVR